MISLTQFNGCLQGALDLPEPDKAKNLKYLSELLQDTSDFSFDSAKACHAMVLTSMEFDKVSWQDMAELDRFRKQHAQMHVSLVKSKHSYKGKSNQNQEKRTCRVNISMNQSVSKMRHISPKAYGISTFVSSVGGSFCEKM